MERTGMKQSASNPRIRVGTGADALAEVVASFPHYKELQNKTSIDPYMIYYTLIKQRLTLDDAVMHMGPYTFLLHGMVDTKASEMKRFKNGSPDKVIPDQSCKTTTPIRKLVSKKAISRTYRHLNPKKERACSREIVIKGAVISLVRTLNAVLDDSGKVDMGSHFDRPGNRYQAIADWLNWVFKKNYKIDTNYTYDQVRQMLKKKNKSDSENKNKYSGRFTTPLIAF